MSPEECIVSEAIFTCIDKSLIDDNLAELLYGKCCLEQQIYIDWLMNRWRYLRTHKDHMPK